MKLFPWQSYVARIAEEVDPDHGGPYYDQVVVLAPRRAGKSALIQAVTFRRCARPNQTTKAWMTAQSGTTAIRRWKDATDAMVQKVGAPYVQRFVGATKERVVWPNGSTFRPFAPDEYSMHGEDPDIVFVDELWRFDDAAKRRIQQGYRPAWLVKPGQEWLLTAAGKPESTWLASARLRGRADLETGAQTRTAFFEWCVPDRIDGVPIQEVDDDVLLTAVRDNHPRTDINVDHLRSELLARGRAEFLRDYGNLDETTDSEVGLIPVAVLRKASTGAVIPEDARVAIGVQVDPERREASISAAWRSLEGDDAGTAYSALIARRPGTRWVLDDMLRVCDRNDVGTIAVRNAGATRDVADELERAGLPVMRVTTPDFSAACNRFVDEIAARTVLHRSENELLSAIKAAGWRYRDGGRVYASLTGEPVTALDAHTLAVWGFDHLPEPKRKEFKWAAY